ncbi:CHAT domain-containing protein [Aspergillus pseudoustus]|uniref:CHAT domain-containing protein n=1 Tax=Aspergillus pseudoustus TaxID=1810923 RepID=A0ABR4K207_9EURO
MDAPSLEEDIDHIQQALQTLSCSDFGYCAQYSELGNHFRAVYNKTGNTEELDRAVESRKLASEASTISDPSYPTHLRNYGWWLGVRFEASNRTEDLLLAISTTRAALEAMPEDYYDRTVTLNDLALWSQTASEVTGETEHIHQAVRFARLAVAATADDDPDLIQFLEALATCLEAHYYQTLETSEDLDQIIAARERILHILPLDSLDRDDYAIQLGEWLCTRFMRTGVVEDIRRAVELGESIAYIHDRPPDGDRDPKWRLYLEDYVHWLGHLYGETQTLEDMDRAIDAAKRFVELSPANDLPRISILNFLVDWLEERFIMTKDYQILDQAIEYGRLVAGKDTAGLEAKPVFEFSSPNMDSEQDKQLIQCIDYLIRVLWRRFLVVQSGDDLDWGITLARVVLDTLPSEHEDRHKFLGTLTDLLQKRFTIKEDMRDLDDHIELFSLVLSGMRLAPDHPDMIATSNTFAVSLHMRFGRTKDPVDMDRAIAVFTKLTEALPRTHPSSSQSFCNIAMAYERKFDHLGEITDLDEAVRASTLAASIATEHDQRLDRLYESARHLYKRFQRTGSNADLDEAIRSAKEATNGASPASSTLWPEYQNSLATYLAARFELMDDMDDLENAIAAVSHALAGYPDDDPRLSVPRFNLGNMLRLRYQRTENIGDLDKGIELLDAAAKSHPATLGGRAHVLSGLGTVLGARFRRLGKIEDLHRSIAVSKEALTIYTGSEVERSVILNSLAINIRELFEQTGKIEDLQEAIEFNQLSLKNTPDGDITKPQLLNNWAIALITRFGQVGDLRDLNEAVMLVEQARHLTPANHANHILLYTTLSEALSKRFERTREYADLDQAIKYAKIVVDERGKRNPLSQDGTQNLAHRLALRFEYSGSMSDLHEAIDAARRAVEMLPMDHKDRSKALYQLSVRLGNRFERLGDMDDIDKAIGLAQQAVDLVGADHIERAQYLVSLADLLRVRYERTGERENINRATHIARMVVDNTPANHPDYAHRLNALGAVLGALFERTKDVEALDDSIRALATAVDVLDIPTISRAGYQMSLGNRLTQRYDFHGQEADLNEATRLYESAIENTAVGHETRRGALNNLAANLIRGSEKSEKKHEQLSRATEAAHKAAEETPRDHPDRGTYLFNLGLILATQYEITGASTEFDQCVQAFKDVLECNNTRPMIRLRSAEWLGTMFAYTGVWGQSAQFFRESLELIPMISPLSLPNSDKQHLLEGFSGMSSMAAAAALNTATPAVEALGLLELGRGVIASLVMDMRADLSDLQVQFPDLASQFIALRDALDVPEAESGFETSLWERRSRERREKEQQFHEICSSIRLKDGFESFLCPPTPDQIMAAAALGSIIVVNISKVRSDAFIITPTGVQLVQLPEVDFTQSEEIGQKLHSPHLQGNHMVTWILEWAWDVIAQPCLDALGVHGPPADGTDIPRIWWILTGPLSHLPIHAAGQHTAAGLGKTVMDRVMSSYSSSIKALIRGRQQQKVEVSSQEWKGSPPSALLVAMETTPEQKPLPFASDEVAMVEKLCEEMDLQPIQAKQKRKEDVLSTLETCTVFHFAGHGKSHGSDPSRSCLLLEDWQTSPLSVADLRNNWLGGHAPFLAYLSACSTGSNKYSRLADEAVHLVSACQLAGFRHVIGTFWAVSDRHCVEVAKAFYGVLRREGMTDLAVCRGLHHAIHKLRRLDIQAREARLAKDDVRQRNGRQEHKNPFLSRGSSSRTQTRSNDHRDNNKGLGRREQPTRELFVRLADRWYTRESIFPPLSKSVGDESCFATTMSEALGHERDERDAAFSDSDEEDEPSLTPLLWAPYFHLGV